MDDSLGSGGDRRKLAYAIRHQVAVCIRKFLGRQHRNFQCEGKQVPHGNNGRLQHTVSCGEMGWNPR